MRPNARRFAEQWLDEHAAENVSAKELADKLVNDGEALGIAGEDFDDDDGLLFQMVRAVVGRSR